MNTAILRKDATSGYQWLEFDGVPDEATRTGLHGAGWRWGGYRKQWYHASRFGRVPAGVAVEDGGACDYSAERAGRLDARAERHQATADAAYARSHAILDQIPFGQPILVGHHSERGHRAALARADRAMSATVQEARTAEALTRRADASRAFQAHKDDAGAIERRIARLQGERTAYENQIQSGLLYGVVNGLGPFWRVVDGVQHECRRDSAGWDVPQPFGTPCGLTVAPDAVVAAALPHCPECAAARAGRKQAHADRLAEYDAAIAEERGKLADAGGSVADQLGVAVGDVVQYRGFQQIRVTKINRKRDGAISSYGGIAVAPAWMAGQKAQCDPSFVTGILSTAG